jgi:hypothetical protein
MSDLQEQTKPILLPLILGETSSLHRKAQTTLSTWIAMFVMVAEFLDKTGTRVAISPKDRLFLKNNLAAPRSMKIWIGYFEKELERRVVPHYNSNFRRRSRPQRSSLGVDFPNTQTTTIVIGKLYIHVLSSETVSIVRKHNMGRDEKTFLYRIHPLKKSPLVWPPPMRLTDQYADAIASAFSERARRNLIFGN